MEAITSKNYAQMLQSFEAAATAMGDNPTLQAEARALAERIEKHFP